MAKFTPLHDRLLVRRIEEGETTVVASSSRQRQEKPRRAK